MKVIVFPQYTVLYNSSVHTVPYISTMRVCLCVLCYAMGSWEHSFIFMSL